MPLNDAGYELNTANVSDAQGDLTSNSNTVTHTRNRISEQTLLSCRTIGEVSVLHPPTKPRIATIGLAPQTLLTPTVKEIFADVTSGNVWKTRTLRKIKRTDVDGSILISNPIHSGISETSTPSYSDSTGTRISI